MTGVMGAHLLHSRVLRQIGAAVLLCLTAAAATAAEPKEPYPELSLQTDSVALHYHPQTRGVLPTAPGRGW